jgi:hypothetical protein
VLLEALIKDLCYRRMFNYNAAQLRINLITVNIVCSFIFLYCFQFIKLFSICDSLMVWPLPCLNSHSRRFGFRFIRLFVCQGTIWGKKFSKELWYYFIWRIVLLYLKNFSITFFEELCYCFIWVVGVFKSTVVPMRKLNCWYCFFFLGHQHLHAS